MSEEASMLAGADRIATPEGRHRVRRHAIDPAADYTAAEAEGLVGLDRKTLYRLASRKAIGHLRLGGPSGPLRFLGRHLLALLDASEVPAAPAPQAPPPPSASASPARRGGASSSAPSAGWESDWARVMGRPLGPDRSTTGRR